MNSMILLAIFITALSVSLGKKKDSTYHTFSIKWPSGIQVDKMTDKNGKVFRFGRLLHNAISLRPEWSSVNVVDNVFTSEECDDIIQKAENYAARFGWSKGRHIDYDVRPTKDLPVSVIFDKADELKKVFDRFESVIWPRLNVQFGIDPYQLRPDDLFITKYNASSPEKALAPHKDKSPWSFVISLNDDFEGGGSYFSNSQHWVRPPKGSAVYFSGNQFHGGSVVTSGVRYILAGFIEYGDGSHEAFMESYIPAYDGYAAAAGFRTGDMIVGLEVCEEVEGEGEGQSDDVTTLTVGSAANAVEGSGVVCTVGAEGEQVCSSSKTAATAVAKDGSYVRTTSLGTRVRRHMEAITGDLTADEDWVRLAQSCELLDPGADTVLRVRRRKTKGG